MNDRDELVCANCEISLRAQTKKCPNCGSLRKVLKINLIDQVAVSDCIDLTVANSTYPSRKKKRLDWISGWVSSRDFGMVFKDRMIDKDNDGYSEIVKDGDGDIITFKKSKLSLHRGFGSDKLNYMHYMPQVLPTRCIDDSACLRGALRSLLDTHSCENEVKQTILDKVNQVTCGNVTCLDAVQVAELMCDAFDSVEVYSLSRIEQLDSKLPKTKCYALLVLEGNSQMENRHAVMMASASLGDDKLLVMDSTLSHEQYQYHYWDHNWLNQLSPNGFKVIILNPGI